MLVTDALGRFGEDLAATHLQGCGLQVLDRNWRCPHGELDLVAWDPSGGGQVVVVEVKTRRSHACGGAVEAVTWRKLARVRRSAGSWLAEHDRRPAGVRVDVVAVTVPRYGRPSLEHLVGVL